MKRLAYRARRNQIVEIDVLIKNDCVVVPRLSRPEPDPTRSTNEGADEDQKDPHQEAPTKHHDREASLAKRVVSVAQRIRIDVGKHHQADHDDARHHYTGNPWIKVNKHLLQSEE